MKHRQRAARNEGHFQTFDVEQVKFVGAVLVEAVQLKQLLLSRHVCIVHTIFAHFQRVSGSVFCVRLELKVSSVVRLPWLLM